MLNFIGSRQRLLLLLRWQPQANYWLNVAIVALAMRIAVAHCNVRAMRLDVMLSAVANTWQRCTAGQMILMHL
jgi:hypothetical protein